MRTIPKNWALTAGSQDYPAMCSYCGVPWPRSRLRKDGGGKLACPDEGRGLSVFEAQQEDAASAAGLGQRKNMSDGQAFVSQPLLVEHASRREDDGTTTSYDAIPEGLGAILNYDETAWGAIGSRPATLTDTVAGAAVFRQALPGKCATVVDWGDNGVPGLVGLSFEQSSEAWYKMDLSVEGGAWATNLLANGNFALYAVVKDVEAGYPYDYNLPDANITFADGSATFVNDMFGLYDNGGANSFAQLGFTPNRSVAYTSGLVSVRANYTSGTEIDRSDFAADSALSLRGPQVVWWAYNSTRDIWVAGSSRSRPIGLSATHAGAPFRSFALGSAFALFTDTDYPDTSRRLGATVGQIVGFSGTVSNATHRALMDYLHLKWGVQL